MTAGEVAFAIVLAIGTVAAFRMVTSRNVVRAALYLVVTLASVIPHAMICAYGARSLLQLMATPCMVTPSRTRMPIAAILRSGPLSSARIHTPARPFTVTAGIP